MTDILKTAGENALKNLDATLGNLNDLLTASLGQLPSKVSSEYIKGYEANLTNAPLKELKGQVEDLASTSIEAMSNVKTLVQLLVPQIQDGGNFGVAIQGQFIKLLGENITEVSGIYEKVATFHEKRAAIVEKLSDKTSNESKTTNVLESVEENKTGKSRTETETVTQGVKSPEQLEALAAVDVRLYVQLKASVRSQRDILTLMKDFYQKNSAKLTDPRGTKGFNYY